jgi:hypothetical protein
MAGKGAAKGVSGDSKVEQQDLERILERDTAVQGESAEDAPAASRTPDASDRAPAGTPGHVPARKNPSA